MADRIRTTHVGSLTRPPELVALLLKRERGEAVDPAVLEATTVEAVEAVVRRQVQTGIDVVNDGEMSKLSYWSYVGRRVGGMRGTMRIGEEIERLSAEYESCRFSSWGRERMKEAIEWLMTPGIVSYECDGPLAIKDVEPLQADLRRLRAAADKAGARDVFMNAASPGIVSMGIENRYYTTREQYLAAIVDVLRPEYEAIVDAGFILQLDCPDLSGCRASDPDAKAKQDFERLQSIEAINAATKNIDPMRMRMHICWGNYQGPHDEDLPLSEVLPIACKARPSGISFEAANPRHEHEWAFFDEFRFPDDKIAIPGVIDNTTTFVEHSELVAQRIARFVRTLGPERVIAGVDCGFATHAVGTYDPEIAFAKLQSLVNGAALAAGHEREPSNEFGRSSKIDSRTRK